VGEEALKEAQGAVRVEPTQGVETPHLLPIGNGLGISKDFDR